MQTVTFLLYDDCSIVQSTAFEFDSITEVAILLNQQNYKLLTTDCGVEVYVPDEYRNCNCYDDLPYDYMIMILVGDNWKTARYHILESSKLFDPNEIDSLPFHTKDVSEHYSFHSKVIAMLKTYQDTAI